MENKKKLDLCILFFVYLVVILGDYNEDNKLGRL